MGTCALKAEWTHSQEEKGNRGVAIPSTPELLDRWTWLMPRDRLVPSAVKAAAGQRHIFTAGHFLRDFSKILSALFLGS